MLIIYNCKRVKIMGDLRFSQWRCFWYVDVVLTGKHRQVEGSYYIHLQDVAIRRPQECCNLEMKVIRSFETSISVYGVTKNYIRQWHQHSRRLWPHSLKLRSAASGIAGLNPARDMALRLLWVLCVVQVETAATGWSLFQRESYGVQTFMCLSVLECEQTQQAGQKASSNRFHNLNRNTKKTAVLTRIFYV